MTKVEKNVVIAAPLDRVYAFTTDWQNLTRYMEYIREVKPTTKKTVGKGAHFALRVKFLGLMLNAVWEATERKENAEWALNATLLGLTAVKRWLFTPEDGSTRVTFTLEYKPSPPVIGPLLDVLLIKRQWENIYERAFQKLKQLIEAETAKSSASS